MADIVIAQARTNTLSHGTTTVPPVERPSKTKVGFLAGAGLLIITLLALATALALLRTLRQR